MKCLFILLALVASAFAYEPVELPPDWSGYASVTRDIVGDVVAGIIQSLTNNTGIKACWKETYGRGVGRPIHACAPDKDQDAGFCYDKCRDGYKGVGPVCWEYCRSGFTDTGAFCGKGGKIISSDHGSCPWYDVCGLTFKKGCSHCPDNDPPYHNDGCTCRYDPVTYAKSSYGRGVGKPLGCGGDEEYDAGLCYPPCRANFKGVGPVCWHTCPSSMPTDDGAVCCTSQGECTDFIKKVSVATAQAVAACVAAGMEEGEAMDAVKKALQVAGGFALFTCDHYMALFGLSHN